MAQWIQTTEPYVKVHEIVKSVPLNPRVGEDLIIGVVLISDAGPSVPTLISNQREFLETYSSKDITQDYLESLKDLYLGADKEIPTTLWENVYRLSGSNTLLVCRASKADNIFFSKPLTVNNRDKYTYLLRDGLLLRQSTQKFKFVLDRDEDNADHDQDGWAIAINGIGVIGNRTTDDGPQYDFYVETLPDLVDQLNESSKFFSPTYRYFTDVKCTDEIFIDEDSSNYDKNLVSAVIFDEVYLGSYVIDTSDPRMSNTGYQYILPCDLNWESTADNELHILDLNSSNFSGFEEIPYYATNQFNSASELRVRIRRFNHDAVITKQLSENNTSQLTELGPSPYTVLESVLDTFTKKGSVEPRKSILERDFFEIAVWDPSVNSEVSFFNVGSVLGRGDMEVSEINSLISMIQLELPDDLHDLGLSYYGYGRDDTYWRLYNDFNPDEDVVTKIVTSVNELQNETGYSTGTIIGIGTAAIKSVSESTYSSTSVPEEIASQVIPSNYQSVAELRNDLQNAAVGYYVIPGEEHLYQVTKTGEDFIREYYIYSEGPNQIYADLTIDPTEYDILKVSDTDLKKTLDKIILDEVYLVDGLFDGFVELSYQNYMANYAINENYFYAISTINSTNYMTIGNGITKIPQDSYKLYACAPWDIDTGTFGWKCYMSPATLYWEAVARNRRNNEEFRPVMGQVGGIMQYQRPVTEFNKKTRQLLLSRRVNTVKWNIQTQAWNMNNNITKTSVDNIMQDEANSRLAVRIAKCMPRLLWQYIGRQISQVTCDEIKGTIDYFFKTVILPMSYTVEAYKIFCDYDPDLARQNRVNVVVNIRFYRTLRYIEVYNCLYDTGMDISTPGYPEH